MRTLLTAALATSALLALAPTPTALAAAGQHTTLASFQQNIRADVLFEPFNGAAQNFFAPYPVSGNGYAYSVFASSGSIRRDSSGLGSLSDATATTFTFTGRPVTAFAGTFRVLDQSIVPIGGTVNITLSTGDTFTVTVPVGGVFFGITTSQPFTSVAVDSPLHGPSNNSTYEFIDDVYVGTSGTAAAASDQCADAPTITGTAATAYPFTTVGATAEPSPGVCDGTIDTGPDVYFRYVAPVHGVATFNTCGCSFDSILRAYANCAAVPLGAQIACNDDACPASYGLMRSSQVSFRVVAGEDYLIRISGYNGESGSGNLSFSIVADCPADFNHSGTLQVQDIFDMLNAWFAGCP